MANPNYTYGVDTNDHAAMKRAYHKYKRRHIMITFLALGVIAFLGMFLYDFFAVNMLDQKPLLAKKSYVENGILYKGIGYNALYCDDGEKYIGPLATKTCLETSTNSYQDVLYNKTLEYMNSKKLLDKSNFLTFSINSYKADSNDSTGTTYLVYANLVCSDGTSLCLKLNVEYEDTANIPLFVTMDRYNKVVNVEAFNKKGEYYKELISNYNKSLQTYLVNNSLATLENIRSIKIDIDKQYGMYSYQGVKYFNSFAATVNYLCVDNTNSCVDTSSFGYFDNLNFEISFFVDKEGNIVKVDKASVFNM